MSRVLNVGGGNKGIPIPEWYAGWEHVLLDIDPRGAPDICCDARQLTSLPGKQFDAVYCSHNLEHYFAHDTDLVLKGFLHVLKDDGCANILVPDLQAVMEHVVANKADIEDVLFTTSRGPITVRDVIYGYGPEIKETGNDFYLHKTGFTEKSLSGVLEKCGFLRTFVAKYGFQIDALAFCAEPNAFQREAFGL
jgi:hypothetical protein